LIWPSTYGWLRINEGVAVDQASAASVEQFSGWPGGEPCELVAGDVDPFRARSTHPELALGAWGRPPRQTVPPCSGKLLVNPAGGALDSPMSVRGGPEELLTTSGSCVHCVDMAERKDKVLNVRVSPTQRNAYERAAALEGVSVSELLTGAADEKAERVLLAHSTMTVASETFDRLLAALDQPAALASSLEKAFVEPRFVNR